MHDILFINMNISMNIDNPHIQNGNFTYTHAHTYENSVNFHENNFF